MRLVFMGTPAFAVPSLEALARAGHDLALVVSREDKPRGRSARPEPPPVKEKAVELGLPIYQPGSVRAPEAVEEIARARPEALCVVAYGRILPLDLLRLPRHGGINVHASLLPRYRGAAPIHWSVANGETETGVTTMRMAEGLDTGDILLQARTPIAPRETAPALSARLSVMGADLLVATLAELAAGTLLGKPQQEELATYAPILKKEDGRIDWRLPAARIDARARGFLPWPGSFTHFRGSPLLLHDIELLPGGTPASPGSIVEVDAKGLVVACGEEGRLRVHAVTPFGRKRMEARAFANGAHIMPGERFDAGPRA